MKTPKFDFLVIGSGIAGLTFALKVAPYGSVAIVTKKNLAESNTNYAQGGIAAVLGEDDSPDLHFADTIKAGAGLCNESAVRILVDNGLAMVNQLISFGVRFSAGERGGGLDLGREGGHSRRRIAHAKDSTGAEIEKALIESVKTHKSITVFESHMAVDLVTMAKLAPEKVLAASTADRIVGAYVLKGQTGEIVTFTAKAVLLATGGVGKVFLYTSNPDIASGDGVAMAYRVGAKIANMEFIQFHPTCLYHPIAKSFLISEAVRGEGAVLKLQNGETFMEKYHEMASLAPRDVVSKAIDREMKKRGDDFVYLDTTMISPEWFPERFPHIYETCKKFGYDPTRRMLPVAPAAHYTCGGVQTSIDGETAIAGLYCAGETAHTGVHGANRLASNSLLEAVVFADRAATSAVELVKHGAPQPGPVPPWDPGSAVEEDELVVINHMWDELRRLMWNYVGVARTDKRLLRAKSRIGNLIREINENYWQATVTTDLLELRNLALNSKLIVECALRRKESRGLHFNMDYAQTDDKNFKRDTVISRDDV